jgi:hypothetical protein
VLLLKSVGSAVWIRFLFFSDSIYPLFDIEVPIYSIFYALTVNFIIMQSVGKFLLCDFVSCHISLVGMYFILILK